MKTVELPALIIPRLWFSLAYAMLALVGVLSLIPSPEIGIEGSDKIMHLATYFILSAGFSTIVRHHKSLLFIAVGLTGYGIMIEYLQGLTGYRYMEANDVLANTAGVLCGLLIRFSSVPHGFRTLEQKLFKMTVYKNQVKNENS